MDELLLPEKLARLSQAFTNAKNDPLEQIILLVEIGKSLSSNSFHRGAQHAFETAKKISIQNLLVPIKLELNGYENEIVRGNLELFSEFGFEVEEFCDNEILIRGVPIFNFRVSIEDTFRHLLENLGSSDPREKVIISMSCKNAIKAGEKLTLEEMELLISDLHKVGKYTCPHGRPIILKMTFDEMNKKFNRK